MVQEIGETRDAIMLDDEKAINQILDANKNRKEKYWIVMFVKPSKQCVDGKLTLVKVIKPYGIKPRPQVGMIVGEVDNRKGSISWDVNMPQAPIDYDALQAYGVRKFDGEVIETTSIPHAYITQ